MNGSLSRRRLLGAGALAARAAPLLRALEGLHHVGPGALLVRRLVLVHAHLDGRHRTLRGGDALPVREAVGVLWIGLRIGAEVLHLVVVRSADQAHVRGALRRGPGIERRRGAGARQAGGEEQRKGEGIG